MMKYLLLLGILIMPIIVFSQAYDLSGLQGLRNEKGDVMLELSGYNIFITTKKGKIDDEKTISSVKKEYNLQEILAEYSESSLDAANKKIEAEGIAKNKSNVKVNIVCYLFTKTEKEITIMLMETVNQRDIILEELLVKNYLKGGLSQYISDDWVTNAIFFAGREIELGTACTWMSPHNVYCNGGQISWSEFSSMEEAILDLETCIKSNENKDISILMDNDVDVEFEGIPTIAYRIVYKQPVEETNPLIAYYIVQEVRGKYLSCVLSNYGLNMDDYELAPLLQQVMSIPQIPEDTYNQSDIPKYNESTEEEEIYKQNSIPMWEIRAGVWLPMGNLKNKFDLAPSVGVSIGVPINKTMSLDVGFDIAFPIKPKFFDFYDGAIYETKADLIAGVNMRWRYQQILSKNLYWTTYLGVGYNAIQTDLEKEYYDDEENKWHSIGTLDVFSGINIRYKSVGCFAEYHYIPYSISKRIERGFGNSVVNAGLSVYFW